MLSLMLGWAYSQTESNSIYIKNLQSPITDENGRVTTMVTLENGRQNLNTELATVEGLRIETYRYLPQKMTNLIIEAPACEYLNQKAWSDGPIQLTSGDGRFTITGKGFLWDHEQSLLVVSNEVQTTILPARTNRTETAETESDSRRIEVTSKRMNYDMASQIATYEREVVVQDSGGLHLTSGRLAVHTSPDADEPDHLTAEENVVVDLTREGEAIRVTGEKAEYEAGEDLEKTAVVTGDPTWRSDRASGSGDRLVFDLTKNRFWAETNAVITLQKTDADQPPFTVRSHRYVYAEDAVDFTGGVSATQTNRLELVSRQMTARLQSREEIEAIEASGEVGITIRDADRLTQATAERMVYTHPNQPDESLRLTGNPEWRSNTHSGSADTMIHFPATQRYLAEGHAKARLNPREAFPASDEEGSAPPGVVTLGDEPLDVESRAYELTPEEGRFSGGVKVFQKDWRMTCESIDIDIEKETGRIRKIAAQENVFVEHDGNPEKVGQGGSSGSEEKGFFGDETSGAPWNLRCEILTLLTGQEGQRIDTILAERNVVMDQAGSTASGGKLRYLPEGNLFELSQNPVILFSDGRTVRGNEDTLVFLDQAAGEFRAEGRYQIRIPQEALRKASPREKPLSRNDTGLFERSIDVQSGNF